MDFISRSRARNSARLFDTLRTGPNRPVLLFCKEFSLHPRVSLLQSGKCFGRMRSENKICGSFWEVVAPKACPGGCSTYTTAKAAPHGVIIPFSGPLRKAFLVAADSWAGVYSSYGSRGPLGPFPSHIVVWVIRPARHFCFHLPQRTERDVISLPVPGGRGNKTYAKGEE